jgi:hypothetical protein|tara:strand:+ start:391 stop:894 length:504 start_codon:yes stop_codon:yes gene_type:complete
MVLGDVVAGIQLVKQSVAFIKENINTCKDISEIAGSIDDLFEGKKQVDKRRSKKDGMSLAEQFGVKSVANEIIDAKLAAEELYNISVLIDQRFGHGTWQTILTERNKRIEAAKQARKEQIRVKRQQQAELMELAKYFFIGLCIIVLIVVAAIIYSIVARDDPLNLMK